VEKINKTQLTSEKLRYRRLTEVELQQLEKKFVDFLVLNGIVADDWARMKTNTPQKALSMIDIFSNMVFETTLKRIEYLRHVSPKELRNIRVSDKKINILSLQNSNPKLDLTNERHLEKIFSDDAMLEGISIYSAEAKHKTSREQTVFELMESGYRACDAQFFDYLQKLS
jgi:hypothetical protein